MNKKIISTLLILLLVLILCKGLVFLFKHLSSPTVVEDDHLAHNEEIIENIKDEIEKQVSNYDNIVDLALTVEQYDEQTRFTINYSDGETINYGGDIVKPIKASIGEYGIELQFEKEGKKSSVIFSPSKEIIDSLIEQYNSMVK